MGEAKYMVGWPAGRPDLKKKGQLPAEKTAFMLQPHNRENISNNIPIPIIYSQSGWGKPNTWLAGQPAGQVFQGKKLPGSYKPTRPATGIYDKFT